MQDEPGIKYIEQCYEGLLTSGEQVIGDSVGDGGCIAADVSASKVRGEGIKDQSEGRIISISAGTNQANVGSVRVNDSCWTRPEDVGGGGNTRHSASEVELGADGNVS